MLTFCISVLNARRPGGRPASLRDVESGVAAPRLRSFGAVEARAQRRAQQGEAAEPVGGLDDYLQHRVDELRVSLAAPGDGRLVGEGADGFEAALDGHQAELVGEVVRVDE